MVPLLHDGDTILVKLGDELMPDAVVVARVPDGGYVVKRVGGIVGSRVELTSLNATIHPSSFRATRRSCSARCYSGGARTARRRRNSACVNSCRASTIPRCELAETLLRRYDTMSRHFLELAVRARRFVAPPPRPGGARAATHRQVGTELTQFFSASRS